MKMVEVILIALFATITSLIVWYILYLFTGGNTGPLRDPLTALMFPPAFAALFLGVRHVIKK